MNIDPDAIAKRIQTFASGLIQDIIDERNVLLLERESNKQWLLAIAKRLNVDAEKHRSVDSLRREVELVVFNRLGPSS